jgi:hypothetical protein
MQIVKADPAVDTVVGFTGGGSADQQRLRLHLAEAQIASARSRRMR